MNIDEKFNYEFLRNKKELENSRRDEKIYKKFLKAGLIGLGYIAVRSFIGPKIDLESISTPLDYFDLAGTYIGVVGAMISPQYLFSFIQRRKSEKKFSKTFIE